MCFPPLHSHIFFEPKNGYPTSTLYKNAPLLVNVNDWKTPPTIYVLFSVEFKFLFNNNSVIFSSTLITFKSWYDAHCTLILILIFDFWFLTGLSYDTKTEDTQSNSISRCNDCTSPAPLGICTEFWLHRVLCNQNWHGRAAVAQKWKFKKIKHQLCATRRILHESSVHTVFLAQTICTKWTKHVRTLHILVVLPKARANTQRTLFYVFVLNLGCTIKNRNCVAAYFALKIDKWHK